MISRKTFLILSSVLAVIVGGLALKAPLLESNDSKRNGALEGPVSFQSPQKVSQATSERAAMASSLVSAVQPLSNPALAARVPSSVASFEYQKEMIDYGYLNKKVFLSDAEKSEKEILFRNENLLRAIGERLRQPSQNSQDNLGETNLALDLLFESLQANATGVAGEVLRSLIQDAAIENPKVELAVRKELAGVKAEILYQWSSLDPAVARDIQAWLPGPVSQQLWKNVRAVQNNNVAESSLEIHN